jgi:hypothetical protein
VSWQRAAEFLQLCQEAERLGIDSIHIPVSDSLSDALALAASTGIATKRIGFRIGWGVDGVLGSLRGRDLLEASRVLPGRLIIHMSFDDHTPPERCAAAREFIVNCQVYFGTAETPRFDVEGESAEAAFLGIQYGGCLWRRPHRANQVYADALPVLHLGKESGLVSFVVTRESRQLALEAAAKLAMKRELDEAGNWITRSLWRGRGQNGEQLTALIGAAEEIVAAIDEFGKAGISHFQIREWPDRQELKHCPAEVGRLIRAFETL